MKWKIYIIIGIIALIVLTLVIFRGEIKMNDIDILNLGKTQSNAGISLDKIEIGQNYDNVCEKGICTFTLLPYSRVVQDGKLIEPWNARSLKNSPYECLVQIDDIGLTCEDWNFTTATLSNIKILDTKSSLTSIPVKIVSYDRKTKTNIATTINSIDVNSIPTKLEIPIYLDKVVHIGATSTNVTLNYLNNTQDIYFEKIASSGQVGRDGYQVKFLLGNLPYLKQAGLIDAKMQLKLVSWADNGLPFINSINITLVRDRSWTELINVTGFNEQNATNKTEVPFLGNYTTVGAWSNLSVTYQLNASLAYGDKNFTVRVWNHGAGFFNTDSVADNANLWIVRWTAFGETDYEFEFDDTEGTTAGPMLIIHYVPISDTCTYSTGNWIVNCSDNCTITTNTNLGFKNLSLFSAGRFVVKANITQVKVWEIPNNCQVIIEGGSSFGQ